MSSLHQDIRLFQDEVFAARKRGKISQITMRESFFQAMLSYLAIYPVIKKDGTKDLSVPGGLSGILGCPVSNVGNNGPLWTIEMEKKP